MLIANPIYDSVFKYLMEDQHVAKKLLSAILGEEILELELRPQEQSGKSDKFLGTIFRVDFKATVKTESGEVKKILIELQKGKHPLDMMRFRRYLAENYTQEDDIEGKKMILPIVTIYILGFELSIKRAILKVNRVYTDVVNGEQINEKDEFIEKLTHDSYVVQIPRLSEKMQTRVEKVLSVFSQRWVTDNKRILNYPADLQDESLQPILQRLARAAESEEVQKQIQIEETFDNSLEQALREKDALLEKKDELLEQKDELLEQKDKAIEELLQEIERLKNKQ